MGYALFANRKIYYVNLVNEIQMQLDSIAQQKQNLLNFNASISDGHVTLDEALSDPLNFSSYKNFMTMAEQKTAESIGFLAGDAIASKKSQTGQEPSAEEKNYITQQARNQLYREFAKDYSKLLAAQENQLDMQQKRLETKLTAAQQQLQAVEQAEGQAIQQATPKYSGLG